LDINTIKNKLSVIFVSLRIIAYPAILGVNLPYRIEFLGGGPPTGVLQGQRYMSFKLSFRM
jgi:hypothetical protein